MQLPTLFKNRNFTSKNMCDYTDKLTQFYTKMSVSGELFDNISRNICSLRVSVREWCN